MTDRHNHFTCLSTSLLTACIGDDVSEGVELEFGFERAEPAASDP